MFHGQDMLVTGASWRPVRDMTRRQPIEPRSAAWLKVNSICWGNETRVRPGHEADLQRFEQYFTSSQTFSHFLRQTNGRLQTRQIFCGKSDFFRCFTRYPQKAGSVGQCVPVSCAWGGLCGCHVWPR